MSNEFELIKKHEGFVKKVYIDTLGNPTFGIGFTYITEEEADMMLAKRIIKIKRQLSKLGWYNNLDEVRKSAIVDMTYQLGYNGVSKFKNMIRALEVRNYTEAKIQALDSKWAKQTPNRAKEIANILEKGMM